MSDKNLNGFKVKKREKGSVIRMATGQVNNREVEGRKESRKEKEGIELSVIIICNLSNDRSKASSKTIPPHSAI